MQDLVVPTRRLLPAIGIVNVMHVLKRDLDALNQRLADHPLVRTRVVGWDIPFVPEKEVDLAPLNIVARWEQLIQALRRVPPAQRDAEAVVRVDEVGEIVDQAPGEGF